MTSELSYWQQAESGRYHLQAVTIQGHSAWWIDAVEPQAGANRRATLWIDWGERSYCIRLRCRLEVCEESNRLLRQMLSTLTLTEVDWGRAPGPPPAPSVEAAPGESVMTDEALASIPYYRGGAYTYANTYWEQEANDDDCYLWSNGNDRDCTENPGDLGVDGAHFVNRAVHADWRPIPGLWDGAALRVADLRNWLQSDGWTTAAANQALVGDVAIMGPFDNPCWAGLVVAPGSDPTLATHSDGRWAPASALYCYRNSQQTFEKTYLHADVEFLLYLPIVLQHYPTPIKERTGIHLGSRQDMWPDSTLEKIDGSLESGVWPRAVVVQSDQLYALDRRPSEQDPLCPIAQARVRLAGLYAYLTKAQRSGVIIIIRITPSPGNFEDWDDVELAHVLDASTTPVGGNYCWSDAWPDPNRQFGYQYFRAIDDVATEMHEIYKLNTNPEHQWNPANFFFEPANEPNNEWYSYWEDEDAQERIQISIAWTEMDAYFSALYDRVKSLDSNIQLLTPPMAQGNFAETKRFISCAPMTVSVSGQSGYDFMPNTFTTKNDGYSWHNYWQQGNETWVQTGDICPDSHHVFQYFPPWLQTHIASSSKSAFITEADLFSPCQDGENSLKDKDAVPAETLQSLWYFTSQEQGADYVVAWLLTEYPYSVVEICPAGPTNYEEIKWHQAYENDSERIWFDPWWSNAE